MSKAAVRCQGRETEAKESPEVCHMSSVFSDRISETICFDYNATDVYLWSVSQNIRQRCDSLILNNFLEVNKSNKKT